MTFELVRLGWPNTAAILALTIIPLVALTPVNNVAGEAGRCRPIVAAAAFCAFAAQSAVTFAAAAQETVIE